MKKLLPLAMILALSACTVGTKPDTGITGEVGFTTSEPADDSVVENEEAPAPDMQEFVLVDRTYPGITNKKGKEWLDAVGAVLVQGDVKEGILHIELSRGTKNTGWSGVGMYLAELGTTKNGNPYPHEERFGTRLHFISAEWRGNCQRSLAPSSSFGVLEEHENILDVDITDVPVTMGDDGCKTGMDHLNLSQLFHDGVYLGFAPSDESYHLKITLQARGDVSVKPL